MAKTKRIVCYVINGSGLGHLTRLLGVARWMRRFVALLDHSTPEVLFLTSSDASDILADARFAAFKIPSKTVAVRSELNKLEYKRQAKHFVWNTLGVFSPDLLVVDTFPAGSFDELFQLLDGPFKKSFILRNVKPEYAARSTFRAAVGMYDKVVSPHRRPAVAESRKGQSEHEYAGEVIQFEREELLTRELARELLGVERDRRLVYLSAGGGGDPEAESALESLIEGLGSRGDLHLLVGAGPLYRGRRWGASNITWFDSPSVWKYFGALDGAISAGGYNTFHELIFAQVPTLFYAQPKIADDQTSRIQEAVAAGAARQLTDIYDHELIQCELEGILESGNVQQLRDGCKAWLPENGARRCALTLLAPLYDASQLAWAAQLLTPAVVHRLERVADGATSALASWLTPLVPPTQFDLPGSHQRLEPILGRLSPAAAQEVQNILAEEASHAVGVNFERALIDLLDAVHVTGAAASSRQVIADETLKTLVAQLRKQPPLVTRNGHRMRWVIDVLEGIRALHELRLPGHDALDLLRMMRMFPRIVDADVKEAYQLFEQFLMYRIAQGDPPHAVLQQLQVVKLNHAQVTKDVMVSLCAEVVT